MSVLPRQVESNLMPEGRDSATPSSTESEGDDYEESGSGAVIPLDVMYAMARSVAEEEDALSQLQKPQQVAQEEEMLRRRRALRARVAAVRQLLPSSKEPFEDEEGRPNAVSIAIAPSNPDSEVNASPVNKLRAHLPRSTLLWHSIYNNIRYLVVSAAYTTGADVQTSHAPNEYYQRTTYE
ncbi:uncharacterized protein Tco025E_06516 [Trypanosoma conorhini]|uniref:Uncharacterized protein n=1 Tax=Trypanosoma conorhini TaxID=83891 RepID=A0A3S5ISM1_9TRYP|nr:uncharacterized protein Tco025E_06516 [Trypanosoma conorhini]RNF12144.1 hypothetical protein Tco025E_06516 [Trypanosoma conorhini]